MERPCGVIGGAAQKAVFVPNTAKTASQRAAWSSGWKGARLPSTPRDKTQARKGTNPSSKRATEQFLDSVVQQVVELARFFSSVNERLNAELREYQRFFDGLTPRLETARMLERELDVTLARRFNVFDYLKSKSAYRVNEVTLSRVIADLLDPSGSHGQGTLFLECLLRCLKWGRNEDGTTQVWQKTALRGAWAEVEREIDDKRRLDVFVHIDKDHCLAIENKPYAPDQQNQVKDYLRELTKYKKSLLIYLSGSGKPPAKESVTLDDLRVLEDDHVFKIMPYDKTGRGDWEDDFDEYRIDYSLAEWLADCRKSCDIDRLRSFLRDAETFCERQFGGNNVTDTETSTIKEFVLSDERNWKTALALADSLPSVIEEAKKDVCRGALDIIWNSKKWESLADDEDWDTGGYSQDETEYSYMEMWRKSWFKHDGGQHIKIRLQAERDRRNDWFIGVRWDQDEEMTENEKDLRRRLSEQLEELGLSLEDDDSHWLCSKYLDKYGIWDPLLIPSLFKECQEGKGDITSYFVRKFVKVAKRAIPIIDGVVRKTGPSTSA